jgi:glycosyltransferase involved in cell wall biosynthesis
MVGAVNSPHLDDLAEAVEERGHEVFIAGYASEGQPPSRDTDGRTTVLPMPRPRPGAGVLVARHLRDVARRVRPDVVHAHAFSGPTLAATLARLRPLVVTAWGSDIYRATGYARFANRWIARRAQAFTADSSDLLEALVRLGAPRQRTELIRYGVDLKALAPAQDRAEVRDRLGLGPGRVILSPRALRPLYNVDVIVEAFNRLAEEDPSLGLVVKYLGADRPAFLDALDGGRVHVVGPVPYERLIDYYRAADVCVSIPDTDSSPRSVWEAMACGCPCVLSDLPWVTELIEPGKHALVVRPEPGEVADAVRSILTDDALARSLSSAGRSLAEDHHDRDAEMDRLEMLYREVADGLRATSRT